MVQDPHGRTAQSTPPICRARNPKCPSLVEEDSAPFRNLACHQRPIIRMKRHRPMRFLNVSRQSKVRKQ
eukprot:5094020-Amphidinium_carterae.1